MLVPSKEILIFRSEILRFSRKYLWDQGFLEVDTPCLKPVVGMEPYLDPFEVYSPNKKEKGYLITSPEFALKQIMARGMERIFEFSHTFRSGEIGSDFHSKEFLMLELYIKDFDLQKLILFIKTFLENLIRTFGSDSLKSKLQNKDWIRVKTVEESFIACTKSGFKKENLISIIQREKLTNTSVQELENWPYEDLFFLVFLNIVEPKLGEGIVFLYDYPPECAALARVDQGVAQRFEIYWDGLELANAFFELKDPSEQRRRFLEEQNLRNRLGKEVFPLDEDFLNALGGEFPDVSGISIGMDRLILRLLEFQKLNEISPYWI